MKKQKNKKILQLHCFGELKIYNSMAGGRTRHSAFPDFFSTSSSTSPRLLLADAQILLAQLHEALSNSQSPSCE